MKFVAQTATPKAMTTWEVEEHSHQDKALSDLVSDNAFVLVTGTTIKKIVKYFPVRGEICTKDKIALRGTHTVLPRSLRQRVLSIAREVHVG